MSETFRPVNATLDISDSYSDIMLLREGLNARLYRASRAGKYFAIKTTKDNSALQLAMLKREYELSITLNHYHLPHFFTFESHTPVGPGIVMEYIDGRNLIEFLAENPTLDTRRRVFSQLLEAVGYIHKNGIIHNDLKPENILVTRANDDVKLLDFGLSDTDAHYLTKTMGCTRAYASPELLSQSDDIDARSDIYSIGKIMHLIFPKNYRSYVRKCLHENRNKRWDNVDQLYRTWNARRKVFLSAILLLGFVALSGVLLLLWDRGTTAESQQKMLLDSLSVARHENLVVMQQFDSIKEVQNEHEINRKQWAETKDIAIKGLKQSLEACYQLAVDSIDKLPFKEFAFRILSNYTANAIKIKNSYVSSVADETISSIISSTFEPINLEYFNTLDNKAKVKPSITDKIEEIGYDAAEYYYSLLQNGLPYRRYK